MFFLDDNVGYAGGADILSPTLLKTTNGGITWTSLANNISTGEILGLHFTSMSAGWILVDNGLYQTTDGGENWTKRIDLFYHNRGGMTFKNNMVGMVHRIHNTSYYTVDGGQNWQKTTIPFDQVYYLGGSSKVVFGVSNEGDLYKSLDDGITWTKVGVVTSKSIEDIYFTDELIGYVLGIDFILKTTNGGLSWTILNDGVGGRKFLDAQTIQYYEGLRKTSDDWVTYGKERTGGTTISDVYFPSANIGYAVSIEGKIFKRSHTSSAYLGMSAFEITTASQASQQTITINSNNNWTSNGVPPWVHLSATSGSSGVTNVVIDIEANNNTYDRNANINIQSGDLTCSIVIFQAKLNINNTWNEQNSGTRRPLQSVFFIDDNVGYAGGEGILSLTLLKTTNGGATWTSLANNIATGEVLGFYFMDANSGWMVTEKGAYQTTDGGISWTKHIDVLYNRGGVAFKNTTTGMIYGDNNAPYYTLDGGQHWQQVTLASSVSFKQVHYVGGSSKVVYAISNGDVLYKSLDDGVTWNKVGGNISKFIGDIYFTDELTGYALNVDFILKTTNGGVNWVVLNENVGGDKLVNAETIQYYGGVYKTSDDWITFNEERISNYNSFTKDVYFPSSNAGYAVVSDGKIFKNNQISSSYLGVSDDDLHMISQASQRTITINSSSSWTISGVPSWVHLSASNGESGTTNIVIDMEPNNNSFERSIALNIKSGDLTHTIAIYQAKYNVDSYWIEQNSGTSRSLQSVFFVDDKVGYAAGEGILSSVLLKTTNGGATWTSLPNNIATGEVLGLYFTDVNTGWISTRNALHQTTDGGISWVKRIDLPNNSQGGVTFKNNTIGIVYGSHNAPYYTLDGGQHWQQSTFPSGSNLRYIHYVEGSSGVIYGVSYNELYKSSDNGAIWVKVGVIASDAIEDIYFTDGLTGYALGIRFILKTTNGGVSWSILNNNIGGRKFLDAQTIQYFDGLYKTSDDWTTHQSERINSITNDVYFPSSGTGYAVISNGTIFKRLPKKQQLINFSTLWNTTFGVAPIDLSANATSSLGVSIKVVSGPATVDGNKLTITGAGTITVEANQPGDDDYLAAPAVQQTFQVNKAIQTITFPAIADQSLVGVFELEATSNSGLEVSFQVVSGNATIEGKKLTITGAGPITVEATQAGNDNYLAANSIRQTFSVIQVNQTIDFPAIADKTFDEKSFDLEATASSGLAVEFQVVSGPATLDGKTLTFTGLGTITVEATQPGNNRYLAANAVRRTFMVTKGVQTIDFKPIADKIYGDTDFDLEATTNSGLTIDFQIISGPVTLNGKTLTITGAGTVVIEANQAGNGNYLAANAVRQTFTINKASQTLTFVPIQGKVLGDADFELQATVSTGLDITFSVVNGPATLNGKLLTMNGVGMVTVKATQVGSDNYLKAEVEQSFLVKSPTPKLVLAKADGSEINTGNTIDFGQTSLGVTISQAFSVQNLGAKDLALDNLNLPNGFSLVGIFPSVITSGSTASFQLQLDASDEGDIAGILSFNTNDPAQSTFELTLSGTVINNPEINLIGNGVGIVNGSATAQTDNHTHFGVLEASGTSVVRTFFIENVGDGILKLTGNPVVQITGANAADFSLTAQPASELNKGNQTAFQITFTPTSAGVKQAQIVIANNDADEGSYTFAIEGEVLNPTALPEQLSMGTIKTFPNPTSERLFLKISQVVAQKIQVQFIDHQGKVVKQQTIAMSKNQILEIVVSDLRSGIYTMMMQVGDQQIARKIIKY
ncbi:hypothetical protein BKI52_24125 [marine bacterium AO1-C]|nr:hypothetical protein BKI52_24125 [marine bacterium AO1-C]